MSVVGVFLEIFLHSDWMRRFTLKSIQTECRKIWTRKTPNTATCNDVSHKFFNYAGALVRWFSLVNQCKVIHLHDKGKKVKTLLKTPWKGLMIVFWCEWLCFMIVFWSCFDYIDVKITENSWIKEVTLLYKSYSLLRFSKEVIWSVYIHEIKSSERRKSFGVIMKYFTDHVFSNDLIFIRGL